ncbi:LacI family DNA-binding transcriptional regulator [Paenibacillus sp. GCM10027626]|uniref:LacI family DNA-binding transcriptional regulator n=1 Tax=Paenibacillus sp. GCM10027626 TaxID=3273411 RepID=UPI0036297137
MTTIRDVAKEAGVSIASVSFAINGTGSISDETRKKILDVVEKLNYRPNAAAKGLVSGKVKTIGLIMPQPGTDFFAFADSEILEGIGITASTMGFNVLLSWEKDQGKSGIWDLIHEGLVRGLTFLLPSNDLATYRKLNDMNFPFVLMSRPPEGINCNWVDVDNMDAAYQATLAFIRAGHKRIAFVSPGPVEYLVSKDRLAGYRLALTNHGLAYDPSCVYESNGNMEQGKDAFEQFMKLDDPPTAVLAGANMLALGILEAAGDAGIQNIALITFDNSELAKSYNISAIDIPRGIIAREATNVLLRKIAQTTRTEPDSVVIPSEIVYRQTFQPADRV